MPTFIGSHLLVISVGRTNLVVSSFSSLSSGTSLDGLAAGSCATTLPLIKATAMRGPKKRAVRRARFTAEPSSTSRDPSTGRIAFLPRRRHFTRVVVSSLQFTVLQNRQGG